MEKPKNGPLFCFSHCSTLTLFLFLTLHPLHGFATVSHHPRTPSFGTKDPVRVSFPQTTAELRTAKLSKSHLSPRGGDTSVANESYGAQEALSSIKLCYTASLFSSVAIAFVTFVGLKGEGGAAGFKLFSLKSFALVKALYRFVFGAGLLKVSTYYAKVVKQEGKFISADRVGDASSTMAGLWLFSACIVATTAMTEAALLKEYLGPTAYAILGPPGIAVLFLVGILVIRSSSVTAAMEYSKKIPVPTQKTTNGESLDAYTARSRGFLAARYMSYCSGAIFLLGYATLITTVVKPSKVVARVFRLLDVFEATVYVKLLQSLNKSFIGAVVAATSQGTDSLKPYSDLFAAQSKFYKKLGKLYFTTSVVQLIPIFGKLAKSLMRR